MNHPVTFNSNASTIPCQYIIEDLKHILVDLLDEEFRRDLQRIKHHLDSSYLAEKMWRAYMLSFILNMDCTNDLIRDLEENPNFIKVCGFDMTKPLPDRRTFNRFICSLANHQEVVERFLDRIINQLAKHLPGFGITVAIDSSSVRSHSHPGKNPNSDPEADFMVKEGTTHKVWKWGYKMQLLIDTTWELPITFDVTSAREADVAQLIPLLQKAKHKFEWFKPWHVVADKGYDAGYNYKAVYDFGSIPIIKMKGDGQKQDNRYTLDERGIPYCHANLPLLLSGHDKKKGMKYICPDKAGKIECPLPQKCSLRITWIRPLWEYRRYCVIPRDSEEWEEIYSKRSAIERVYSRLIEHRRLNSHCHRGLQKIRLHCLMSVLSLALTALAEINGNRLQRVRACTRKVA
ncbi:transposase [Dehalococcoidales bacterium]|nr:transposase [Dehalococcoidales bacterium]